MQESQTVQWDIVDSRVSMSVRYVMKLMLQISEEGMCDLMNGSGIIFHIEGKENISYFSP